MANVVVPGMRLKAFDNEHIPGKGTYEKDGFIYSTLAGIVVTNEDKKDEKVKILSVISKNRPAVVPKQGDIVTAKVTVINPRFCKCIIYCVEDTLLSRPYRGLLRKEDVRATNKDRVDMYKSYRPGDIILARVLPMTELYTYQLSTAENELGVAAAIAEGAPQDINMVPISWTEMQCPKTHTKEPRKVAKLLPENLHCFPKEYVELFINDMEGGNNASNT